MPLALDVIRVPYQARPLKSQGFIKHLVMAQMSTQRIIKHHTHTVCSKCSCFAICSLRRSLSMPCDRFIPHGVDSNLHCLQTIRELYSTTIATKTRTVCRFISFNCFSFLFFSICLIGRLIMKVGMNWCVCVFFHFLFHPCSHFDLVLLDV